MPLKLSDLVWWRVVTGAVLAVALSWATVFVIVTGFAARLGFKMKGAPPQDQISAFAERIGPVAGPIAGVVLTLLLAIWVARRASASRMLNAIAMGVLVVVVLALLGRSVSLASVSSWFATIGAAWVGGLIGSRSSQ